MPDYVCLGQFSERKAGHSEHYFAERYSWLDFRGELSIDPTVQFGFCNMIITQSHDITTGEWRVPVVNKKVTIGAHAWITSRCMLYNCEIGHHAIVACGAVVRNMTVPPYTIVEGNPAKVVAKWNDETKKWERVE